MSDWAAGTWLNPPPAVTPDGDDLLVTAAAGSDLWQAWAWIAGITLVAVPLLVVIIGVLVWTRRRASYRPE